MASLSHLSDKKIWLETSCSRARCGEVVFVARVERSVAMSRFDYEMERRAMDSKIAIYRATPRSTLPRKLRSYLRKCKRNCELRQGMLLAVTAILHYRAPHVLYDVLAQTLIHDRITAESIILKVGSSTILYDDWTALREYMHVNLEFEVEQHIEELPATKEARLKFQQDKDKWLAAAGTAQTL